MAEAFLQFLLDNLTSFINDKLVLFFGFEKEFEKLSSMFSTIQAVLEDAQEKKLKDKAIENWLQKFNGAAYEVDDILDECKSEATIFEQSRLGFHHQGIITFRHKIGETGMSTSKLSYFRDFQISTIRTHFNTELLVPLVQHFYILK